MKKLINYLTILKKLGYSNINLEKTEETTILYLNSEDLKSNMVTNIFTGEDLSLKINIDSLLTVIKLIDKNVNKLELSLNSGRLCINNLPVEYFSYETEEKYFIEKPVDNITLSTEELDNLIKASSSMYRKKRFKEKFYNIQLRKNIMTLSNTYSLIKFDTNLSLQDDFHIDLDGNLIKEILKLKSKDLNIYYSEDKIIYEINNIIFEAPKRDDYINMNYFNLRKKIQLTRSIILNRRYYLELFQQTTKLNKDSLIKIYNKDNKIFITTNKENDIKYEVEANFNIYLETPIVFDFKHLEGFLKNFKNNNFELKYCSNKNILGADKLIFKIEDKEYLCINFIFV